MRKRRRVKRKLKVYAVDAAMVFLAVQVTTVIHADKGSLEESRERGRIIASQAIERAREEKERDLVLFVPVERMESEDEEIMLKIAMAEAEGESTKGKALVMRVVLNRMEEDEFPDCVESVVFEEGQFSPLNDGRYWDSEPDEDCYRALRMVENGWDESQGALYFCRTGASTWMEENLEYLFTEGNHSFYR